MTSFAGIDVGTGGVRCLVVDERGARRGYAARAWSYAADAFGWPTLDPAEAMRVVDGVLAEAAGAQAPDAVGVTSQRTGVVFLDDARKEILISPNTDGRAAMVGASLEAQHGDAIYRIARRLPAMLSLAARLGWVRANRLAEPTLALSLADWVVSRLTGNAATERTQGAEMGVLDVADGTWSAELCGTLDVPITLLPPVLDGGVAAGSTQAGVGVVPAGTDSQCAALALGVTQPGEAFVVAGTTMIAERVVAHPVPDPERRVWTSPHHVRGLWVHEAHCGEAGSATDWMARLMDVPIETFAGMASNGEPGAGGVSFVDPYPSVASNFALLRTGAMLFAAPLLALGRGRDDVARAVYDGIAFGARAGLDVLDGLDGEPSSLACAGGVGSASPFARALAGASRRPVTVATEPASSALGAAIVAASSHHGGVHEAVAAMRDRGREVAPSDDDGYPAHYARWRERAQMLDDTATRVSDLMR